VSGIDVFDPKFNIVSPGADPEMFFPYTEQDRRFHHLEREIEELAFGEVDAAIARGVLAEPEKPLLFTMARLDHIKNITGFVEWFGRSRALRDEANVFIISGHLDPEDSTDDEERGQIERMHELMDRFELDGEVRWLGTHVDQAMAAEALRFAASRRGAFVQPALFEAFGLTVVEAMCCGLPTFATCFGGPLEIIEDGVSGFHLDPNHGDAAAAKMADFFARCRQDPEVWHRISKGGMERVEARYTWRRYAERMMTLSRIYGFWRYVSDLERAETRRYLEMFYSLQLRPLAASVNGQ
jgi:sucrose synthase